MSIEKILSSSHLRQLHLVRFLIVNGPVSQKVVLNNFNYSNATLYRDISNLNSTLDPVKILTNDLIRISVPINYNNRFIFSALLNKSTEFNLIEEIYFHENHSLLSLADMFFVSESTVRRMIQKINKELIPYGFKIGSSPINLLGNEKNIYNFMVRYFEETYPSHDYPFSSLKLNVLQKIILATADKKNDNFNYPDVERLKLIIIVIITRIQNGHTIDVPFANPPSISESVISNPVYKKLFKTIFKINLNTETLNQILYPFSTTNFSTNLQQLKEIASQDERIEKKVSLFTLLVEKIATHYSISLENTNNLVLHLFNTSELKQTFTSILYDKNKAFVDEATLYNTEFINYVKKEITQLKENPYGEKENIFSLCYILITHWKNLAIQLKRNSTKLKVGLFFDSDLEHMYFIQDSLSEELNHILDIVPLDFLTKKELKVASKNFDFILTTIPDLNYSSVPVICISMYLKSNDFENIVQMYKTIQRKKNLMKNKQVHTLQPVFLIVLQIFWKIKKPMQLWTLARFYTIYNKYPISSHTEKSKRL